MKNTFLFIAAGIVSWLLVGLVFALLVSCAGCRWDPITPPAKPHGPRPNPYGLTNAPPTP